MAVKAKRVATQTIRTQAEPVVVSLSTPGMTPLLKSGVGGLAAALRAIALRGKQKWPTSGSIRVELSPGSALVEERQVTIDWGGDVEATLKTLVDASFTISKVGLIDFPATRHKELPLELQATLQDALKRTFLQHGKSTTKRGAVRTTSIEIDDKPITVVFQPHASFAHHENAVSAIVKAVRKGVVDLPGWAYPGAAVRHTGLGASTSIAYSPSLAVAAFFAIIGSVSLIGARRAGVLLIPRPRNLLRFARVRPDLTPASVARATVSGANDAVLTAWTELRALGAEARDGVEGVDAVLLRATPWDKKQKYRVATTSGVRVDDARLMLFETAVRSLETRLVPTREQEPEQSGYFASPSLLREFVAENLANQRPWYHGFATCRPDGERFLHCLRSKNNKGALQAREKEGLVLMTQSLENAEVALVRAVHTAIRHRFGAIANETAGMARQARHKRWDNERERWRLAFAQSKTHEQVRAALADLWSRGGRNTELKDHWEVVLPMLRADRWAAARDLALVALASYRGSKDEEVELEDHAADQGEE